LTICINEHYNHIIIVLSAPLFTSYLTFLIVKHYSFSINSSKEPIELSSLCEIMMIYKTDFYNIYS